MNVKEEKICRICLKVAENDFQIIDENARKIFEVLLLKVDLDIIKDPIICKDCAKAVEKCFNFKSTCINAKELVSSYAINKKKAMFELEDIHKNGKDIDTIDHNFRYRFCSNDLNENDFVLLDTLMNDVTFTEMLRRLMPEMDFEIIKNPIICTNCTQNLEYYVKFVENCLDTEEKITKYLKSEGTSSSANVRLGEILEHILTRMIKQEIIKEDIGEEHSEGYDSGLIKTEEIDIKDEEACESPSDVSLYKLNMPRESKLQIGNTQLTQSVSYLINKQSNMISEIGMGKDKPFPLLYQMLSTENILGGRVFKCTTCTYETKRKDYLNRHMLIHKDIIEEEMFKCSMCTYKTKVKSYLKRHTLIHKDITEVKMYKCAMCTYETRYKSGLKSHTLTHKDIMEVEMYKCSMCTYETKYKTGLKCHMLTHKDIMEVEMHKCSMCTYKAKNKYNLKKHTLIHKDITEVKMYKCSMCTFQTKRKNHLTMHMLIHKDITEVKMHKCSMCTFETKYKGGLKCHMLTHKDITEVKMHKCSMCTYETKYRRCLKTHMLLHKDITEVDMYKCPMCSYETRLKGSLTKHMLVHKNVT